jgi:hypothetical protein
LSALNNVKTEKQLYDLSTDGIQIRYEKDAAKIICYEGKITKKSLNMRTGKKT